MVMDVGMMLVLLHFFNRKNDMEHEAVGKMRVGKDGKITRESVQFTARVALRFRNMLKTSGPFRFQREQFEFLGGDAFHYLQRWQLGKAQVPSFWLNGAR